MTINDIQQSILDKKATFSELDTLEVLTTEERASNPSANSTSRVAEWRLIVYIVSTAIWLQKQLMDIFFGELDAKVKANRPHTPEWYKSKALAFQNGDTLIDSDEYAVIDPTKMIIKQVAILEGDRKIIIKVATLSGSELVKIDDANQVLSFKSYMNKVKDAGTVLEVINEDADELIVELDFYYDALVVKSDGTIINTPSVNVVEKAIKDYLLSLDFNGEFEVNRLTDYIQKAIGYKSMKLNYVGFKAGLATTFTPIDRAYTPLAGYMKLTELNVTYHAHL